MVRALPVLVIDGNAFDDFEGFAVEFSGLLTDYTWNQSLDAFDDILRGGYGTPEDGFVLRWTNSNRSRQMLGWQETVKYHERKLSRCHPQSRPRVKADLEAARNRRGQTLFDLFVGIIKHHGDGGRESKSNVVLELA